MFNCRHIVTDIHLLNISHLLKRMNYIVDLYISVLGGIIVVSLHLLVAFRIITHILVIFCEFLVLVSLFTYQIFLFFLPLSWNSSVAYLSFSLLTFFSGAIFLRRKYQFLNNCIFLKFLPFSYYFLTSLFFILCFGSRICNSWGWGGGRGVNTNNWRLRCVVFSCRKLIMIWRWWVISLIMIWVSIGIIWKRNSSVS